MFRTSGATIMIPSGATAIVGAAESTEIGAVPNMSSVGLAIDAAANAMSDAGIAASDLSLIHI